MFELTNGVLVVNQDKVLESQFIVQESLILVGIMCVLWILLAQLVPECEKEFPANRAFKLCVIMASAYVLAGEQLFNITTHAYIITGCFWVYSVAMGYWLYCIFSAGIRKYTALSAGRNKR